MRKRLLVATVGTVAIGVLLLGLPLAVAVRGVLTTQAFETLQRQAEQVQVLFNQQQLSGTERRDLLHDLAGQFDDRLAGRGHPGQVLAAAGEDLHTQFVLEQADLLGDARLRGEQALCRCRDIEVVPGDFPDIAQLLQFHAKSLIATDGCC